MIASQMLVIPMIAMNQVKKYSFDPRPKSATKMASYIRKFNFAYAFRPIYYFCRVFGLMPFKITYYSNGTIHGFEIATFDIIWFIISMAFNLVLAFLMLRNSQHVENLKNMSIILVGGDFILQVFSMVFDVILIGMDMCISSKLVRILKKINAFDEEVSECIVGE